MKRFVAYGELWYKRAAEAGQLFAMRHLARSYIQGTEGVARDVEQALLWWERAAAQGDKIALLAVGQLYEAGAEGLPPDREMAEVYYMIAASLGSVQAMDILCARDVKKTRLA